MSLTRCERWILFSEKSSERKMKSIFIAVAIAAVAIWSWVGKMIVRENLIGIDEGNMWPPEQAAPFAHVPDFPYWMPTQDL